MKKRFVLILLTVLSSFSMAGAAGPGSVAATVNSVAILDTDVRWALSEKLPYASFHRNLSAEKMKELYDESLQELIEHELLYQSAETAGMTPDAEAVAKQMAKIRSSYPSEREFQEALEKGGLTDDRVKQRLSKDDVVRRYLDAEVIKKAAVSDEYLSTYYRENRAKYVEPDKWKLREILIKVAPEASAEERLLKKEKAEDVLKQIRNGKDFGLLAWEYSEDEYRYKSGEIGYMHKGMLMPEIEHAVEVLKPGESTGLIETIYGYYIFYLENRAPGRQLTFDDVKDKLRKEMQQAREKELKKGLLDGLKAKAEIVRNANP